MHEYIVSFFSILTLQRLFDFVLSVHVPIMSTLLGRQTNLRAELNARQEDADNAHPWGAAGYVSGYCSDSLGITAELYRFDFAFLSRKILFTCI